MDIIIIVLRMNAVDGLMILYFIKNKQMVMNKFWSGFPHKYFVISIYLHLFLCNDFTGKYV